MDPDRRRDTRPLCRALAGAHRGGPDLCNAGHHDGLGRDFFWRPRTSPSTATIRWTACRSCRCWKIPPASCLDRGLFWRMKYRAQHAMRRGKWKYLKIEDNEYLFDLSADERERANRARHEPQTTGGDEGGICRLVRLSSAVPPDADYDLVVTEKEHAGDGTGMIALVPCEPPNRHGCAHGGRHFRQGEMTAAAEAGQSSEPVRGRAAWRRSNCAPGYRRGRQTRRPIYVISRVFGSLSGAATSAGSGRFQPAFAGPDAGCNPDALGRESEATCPDCRVGTRAGRERSSIGSPRSMALYCPSCTLCRTNSATSIPPPSR